MPFIVVCSQVRSYQSHHASISVHLLKTRFGVRVAFWWAVFGLRCCDLWIGSEFHGRMFHGGVGIIWNVMDDKTSHISWLWYWKLPGGCQHAVEHSWVIMLLMVASSLMMKPKL